MDISMEQPSTAGPALVAAWRSDRAYLVDLAFRMLHDVGAAEDTVQEAFFRLSTAEQVIDDARGWLTVVTSRLCLDQIRSAQARRERTYGADAVERVLDGGTRPRVPDPADRVTLDDEVRQALAVVLDRLTPAERVAFVLHDVFAVPYVDIEQTLGKSAVACRQLVRRARQKIAAATADGTTPVDRHLPDLSRAFLAACGNGDLEALLPLLHPDVWGVAELTGRGRASVRQERHGAGEVASTLLRHFGSPTTLVTLPSGTDLAFLAFRRGRPYASLSARLEDGRISSLHAVVGGQDPSRGSASASEGDLEGSEERPPS